MSVNLQNFNKKGSILTNLHNIDYGYIHVCIIHVNMLQNGVILSHDHQQVT